MVLGQRADTLGRGELSQIASKIISSLDQVAARDQLSIIAGASQPSVPKNRVDIRPHKNRAVLLVSLYGKTLRPHTGSVGRSVIRPPDAGSWRLDGFW